VLPSPQAVATPSQYLVESENEASPEELARLRQLALDLINEDRAAAGVDPVQLGTNPTAQLHAENALINRYVGHWWTNGDKPYMVYTETGGTSYIAENAAGSGWTFENYEADECGSFRVRCEKSDPEDNIRDNHRNMVHFGAHAGWGHRDNILDPTHLYVNIGIAYNEWWTAFYQHFEGGHFTAVAGPTLEDNTFTFTIRRNTGKFQFSESSIGVFYDPEPKPMSVREIDRLSSYCIGGGATDECDIDIREEQIVAWIIEPLSPGWSYPDLDQGYVIASEWTSDGETLHISADLGAFSSRSGVYTLVVWGDEADGNTDDLIMLSARK